MTSIIMSTPNVAIEKRGYRNMSPMKPPNPPDSMEPARVIPKKTSES
jgi:hypothetical protein